MTRRVVRLIGQNSARLHVSMGLAIPSVRHDVAATAERNLIVDNHHFLMMAGPKRDIASLTEGYGCVSEEALAAMPSNVPMVQDGER